MTAHKESIEDEGTCGEVQEIKFGGSPDVHVSKIHPPVPDPNFPGRVIVRIDLEDDEVDEPTDAIEMRDQKGNLLGTWTKKANEHHP